MENHLKSADGLPSVPLKPTAPEHWRVLLAEFVHLMGLLLIHSRHAQSVRATSVLFEQMMRHLKVLEKMPGHEGTLMLSCGAVDKGDHTEVIQYRILFGNMILQRTSHDSHNLLIAGKHGAYLNNALDQTFDYLVTYGIESLFLQFPGELDERIDQLRLALNIVARIQDAVKSHGTVTFHYGDRPLTVPLICNPQGKPDFNLTLLAGINGLSAANAEELIKQAQAFHDLALAANRGSSQPLKVVKESYNQIFKVRSLRSQIVRPLVEVNNIPWIGVQPAYSKKDGDQRVEEAPADHAAEADAESNGKEITYVRSLTLFVQPGVDNMSASVSTRQYLSAYFVGDDPKVDVDLDAVLADDYTGFDRPALGERLVAASRLLHGIDKKSQDPAVGDRLLYLLQTRLLQVDEQVLANIEVQNQGLRFVTKGRTMVVGLVHPRMVDMITLVKDQVLTRQKIAVIGKIAFEFDDRHTGLVANAFNVSNEDARRFLDLLKSCFDAQGGFRRDAFEDRINGMALQANTFFEVTWSFLQATPHRKDRLALLNAVQLLMERIEDPKRTLRFILDDLCRHTDQVDYTDRNAFVLGNVLMQAENKTLHVDLGHTPESIFSDGRDLNNEVQRYALWRVNTDQVRVVNKLATIHDALEALLKLAVDGEGSAVDFLLALEREALIFLALVNGPTARQIIIGLQKIYGDPEAAIYAHAAGSGRLSSIMAQLQVVIHCMGWVGYKEHIPLLQTIAGHAEKLLSLDTHPAYALQVKQTMNAVADTIKQMQARAS